MFARSVTTRVPYLEKLSEPQFFWKKPRDASQRSKNEFWDCGHANEVPFHVSSKQVISYRPNQLSSRFASLFLNGIMLKTKI